MAPYNCPVCNGTGLGSAIDGSCQECGRAGVVWKMPENCEHGASPVDCYWCQVDRGEIVITTSPNDGSITLAAANEFDGPPTFRSRVRFD